MVERRADDVDVVVLRLDSEEEEDARQTERRLLGREPAQRPVDTLRVAGRPRRVVHDIADGPVLGVGGRLRVAHGSEGAEPGDLADREAGRGGELRLLGRLERHVGEALVGDERLGVRVAQDVGDLRADQVVVDRHQVPAGLEGGEVELEHLDPVGEQGGDHVAVAEPELPQAVNDLVHPPQQLTRGVLGAVGSHQREVVGVFVRQCPESEIAHVIGPPLCRMVPVVLSFAACWCGWLTRHGRRADRVAPDRRRTLEQVLVDGQPPVARGAAFSRRQIVIGSFEAEEQLLNG